MFTFDFATNGAAKLESGVGTTVENTADGVIFTLSGNTLGGPEFLVFGNTEFAGSPIVIDDLFDNDTVELKFKDEANPSINKIDGTVDNPIKISWGDVAGTWNIVLSTRTPMGSLSSVTGTTVVSGADSGMYSAIVTGISVVSFTSTDTSSFSRIVIQSITGADFNCFCAGTRIATPDGDAVVEALKPGDEVLTADGKVTTVRWLGRQQVDVRMSDPRKINPICISKGALGENVPVRDLWVSQDHAIGIDGYLVNAGTLVNGSTIYQVAQMPLEGFTYYHIETDAHELLLAEGCPVESFVDYAALDAFENASDRANQMIPEMPVPRVSAARMIPQAIREQIAARARRIAFARAHPTRAA